MATYEICGTCTIHCDGAITKFRLSPSIGYVSPNKQWAICYPHPLNRPNAKLHKLEDGYCVISAPKHEHIIISAAATQKKIQLFLNERLEVTGATFPAP
jgi:hypothetical protein